MDRLNTIQAQFAQQMFQNGKAGIQSNCYSVSPRGRASQDAELIDQI